MNSVHKKDIVLCRSLNLNIFMPW